MITQRANSSEMPAKKTFVVVLIFKSADPSGNKRNDDFWLGRVKKIRERGKLVIHLRKSFLAWATTELVFIKENRNRTVTKK